MIHVIGDSHSLFTFADPADRNAGIPGVARWYLGPRTMRRITHLDDPLLPDTVKNLGPLGEHDAVLCCFGEIDLRCHLQPLLAQTTLTPEAYIRSMADRYLHRVQTLEVGEARAGVVTVTPPTPAEECGRNPDEFPVSGTDEERAGYVKTFNRWLYHGCYQKGLLFVDVHTPYADDKGMMRAGCSDGCIHIRQNDRVPGILRGMGLL